MDLKFSKVDPLDGSWFTTFAVISKSHYYTLWVWEDRLCYNFCELGKRHNPTMLIKYINKVLEYKNTGINKNILEKFLK